MQTGHQARPKNTLSLERLMSYLPRLSRCVILFTVTFPLSQGISSYAQTGGGSRPISGSVIVRGSAVGSVRVTVESLSRSYHRIVFADGSGSFVIGPVAVGQYIITLEAEGFVTLRDSLDVTPGVGPFMVQYVMNPKPKAATSSPSEPGVSVPTLQVPAEAKKQLDAGMNEFRAKRTREARKHFEKALSKFPQFPQAFHALALLDAAEQHTDLAVERLQKAVEIDASYGEGFITLSRLLNLLGRYTEALDAAQKGVKLRRDVWQGHYEMGVAALSLGQEEVVLEASARIDTLTGAKSPEVRLLRSGVFLRRLQYTEAKAELLAFLEAAPNHPLAELARQTLRNIEAKLQQANDRD